MVNIASRGQAPRWRLLGKGIQFHARGKCLFGIIAAGGLADNPHGNRPHRLRQAEREPLAGPQVPRFVAVVDG